MYNEYAVVYYEDSFIYFGGFALDDVDDDFMDFSTIAKFDTTTRQWSRIGNLINEANFPGRKAHGAIFDGSYFLVVGKRSRRNSFRIFNMKLERKNLR